jgi:hypothetical protein
MSGKFSISKITPATIGATKHAKKNIPGEGAEPFGVATIIGNATGTKQFEMKDTGEVFTALTGDFEAKLHENGDVYNSGVLFFPGGIHERAVSLMTPKGEKGKEGYVAPLDSLIFSFELGVVYSKSPAGYTWVMREVIPTTAHDPLDDLRQATAKALEGQKQAALPRPEKKAS